MLKEKLTQDLKEALKSGNAKKRLVVGMVLNSVKNRELQKRAKSGKEEALNDEEILEVIASEVKKRKESIESFKAGGREELAQNEKEELDILMTYMPEQMSEDAIREEVRQTLKACQETFEIRLFLLFQVFFLRITQPLLSILTLHNFPDPARIRISRPGKY